MEQIYIVYIFMEYLQHDSIQGIVYDIFFSNFTKATSDNSCSIPLMSIAFQMTVKQYFMPVLLNLNFTDGIW